MAGRNAGKACRAERPGAGANQHRRFSNLRRFRKAGACRSEIGLSTVAATNLTITVTGEVEPGANSNKWYSTWAFCRGVSARVNPEEGTFSLPGVPLYPGTKVLVVLVRDVSGN